MKLLRSSLVFAAAMAALSAQAVTLQLISAGTLNGAVANEAVLQQMGGFGALSTLTYTGVTVPSNATGGSVNATAVYSGPSGSADSLTLLFQFGSPDVQNGSTSYSGLWSVLSGTGGYLGTTGNGSGTFATNLLSLSGTRPSSTILSGNINAVPEPASLAALAVGGVGLVRRRRRG